MIVCKRLETLGETGYLMPENKKEIEGRKDEQDQEETFGFIRV